MKILALDTSTNVLCLGMYAEGKIYEYHLEAGTRMSSLLADTIRRVLETLKIKAADIDYFACGRGPGSFTGTRIGISCVKGMSWALKKPVIGISTLDILAEDVDIDNEPIVPVVDAKRNLVYCAVFKRTKAGIRRIKRPLLVNQNELLKIVPVGSIVLGDGVAIYKEALFRSVKGLRFLDNGYWYPKAHNIINRALKQIEEKKISTAFDITPLYLYPKECQIKGVAG